MITPKELEELKAERVKGFVSKAMEEYEVTLRTKNPDGNGCWSVSLPSLPWFTPEERAIIKKAIESEFTASGWDFEPTHLIYGYRIKPL